MKIYLIIGLGILLLVSGCLNGNGVRETLEVPVSGAPYDYNELSSVTTRFPMMVVRNATMSEISDVVLEKVALEIKTFTGEKYVKFEPTLKLEGEDERYVDFVFSGVGYVNAVNFDEYEFYMYYDKETGKADYDQTRFVKSGIPTKFKIIAEEIARKEKGIYGEEWPLNYQVWDEENNGYVEMRFNTEYVVVDLKTGVVVE